MTLWWIAILGAWLAISFALLDYVSDLAGSSLLLTAVAAVVIVITVGLLRPRWVLAVGVAVVGLYSGLWFWVERETGNPAAVLAVATAIGGTAWLGSTVHSRIISVYRQAGQFRRRTRELSREDEATGALKFETGISLLASEIERCRRYRRSVTLLQVGVANFDEWVRVHGMNQGHFLARNLVQLLQGSLRTVDAVFTYDGMDYLVMLPETSLEQARVVAHRIAFVAREQLSAEFRVGVAEFPSNGLSTEELLREAGAAISFARLADLTVGIQE